MCVRPFTSLAGSISLIFFLVVSPWLPAADEDSSTGPTLTLRGHREAVYGVLFTSDGKQIVTASGDPSVKVWQADSGKEFKTFGGASGHTGLVLSLALSPDGAYIASGSADNSLRVWDFPTSKPIRSFDLLAAGRAVAVSPDGSRLAGGDKSGKIRLWNTPDGKQLHEWAGFGNAAVSGLAFHPNGQALAAVDRQGTLLTWNVGDGKQQGNLVAHPGPVTAVGYNTGGSLLFTAGADGNLRLWNPPTASKPFQPAFKDAITAAGLSADGGTLLTASGRVVRLSATNSMQSTRELPATSGTVRSIAALSGNALVAAGCDDQRVCVWRGSNGEPLMNLPAHAGGVTGVAFNPAGNQLASVGADGMLRLWQVPPTPPRSVAHAEIVSAAGVSADGKHLLTAAADRTLRLYQIDNLKTPQRQFTQHPGTVKAVALSGDGKSFLTGSDDGLIRLYDAARAEPISQIGGHTSAITSLQKVGADRVLSASADGSVKLWQVAAAKQASLSHAGSVSCAALTADGSRLVTGCADKQLRVWTVAKGQLERTLGGPTLGITSVGVTARGDHFAAGSADKCVYVWDTTGKMPLKITLAAVANGIVFVPDGRQLIAALADGSVRVFDAASGKEVRAFNAHKMSANSVLLAAGGKSLVTAGADGLVQISPLGGGAAASIKHGAAVSAAAVSRDGSRVAVGGADKTVKVYALAGGKLEATIVTPAEVRDVAFSPVGKRLAVAGGDGKARIYDEAGTLEEHFAHDGPVQTVLFSADGRQLYSGGADKAVRVHVPALLWQVRYSGGARQAILSSRGDRIVTAAADGRVRLHNAADGKVVQTVHAHQGSVKGIAIWPDAGKIVSLGDGAACVWDLSKLPAAKSGGKELDKPALEMKLPEKSNPLACCLSPSGLRLAVGVSLADKQQVRIFDTSSGKELLALGESGGMPAAELAFLPDNRSLLAAGGDKVVHLTDVNILTALEVHKGGCSAVAWHGNGSQILTGGADKQVKLWTVPAGKLERSFATLDAAVTSVALARDNSQVAAVAGKTLRVWSVADGKQLVAREMPASATAVAFSADRTRLAVAASGEARVLDASTGDFLQAYRHAGAVAGVLFSPASATTLYTAGADRTAWNHTLAARQAVKVGSPLSALAVSTNGAQVATAAADGKLRLYNANNATLDRTIQASAKALTAVAFSRNNTLVATGGVENKVNLYNPGDGKLILTITTSAAPRCLSFHPNNRALIMTAADGSVVVWDVTYNPGQVPTASFGKVLQSFRHGAEALDVSLANSAANMVFYTAGDDKKIEAWKLASDTAIRNFGHPNTVNSVAFNKDGTLLASGCGDGQVRLFDAAKGSLVRQINAHPGKPNEPHAVYSVAFSPDGKQIVSASYDHSLKLWNVADGKLVREFKGYAEKTFAKGHQEAVLCVAFSPDGKQIASGGMDRTVKIWNVANGNVERELINPAYKSAHPGWVYALRWLDGGKTIASVSGAPRLKGSLAEWDASTGKLLASRELAVGTIYALAVSPDEKVLAVGTGGSLRSDKDYNTGLLFKRGK